MEKNMQYYSELLFPVLCQFFPLSVLGKPAEKYLRIIICDSMCVECKAKVVSPTELLLAGAHSPSFGEVPPGTKMWSDAVPSERTLFFAMSHRKNLQFLSVERARLWNRSVKLAEGHPSPGG